MHTITLPQLICRAKTKKARTTTTSMADHQIFQTFKQSFSLADIDSDVEFIDTYSGLYQNHEDYSSSFNFNNSINILPQLSSLVGHGSFENGVLSQAMISPNDDHRHKERKRKAIMDLSTLESTCSYSSPQVSDHSGSRKKNPGGGGGGRGKKVSRKGEEKPREVVHVRAKRGQATDSHSLAERVRRGKINERLRCLQDIVPGCYKTMGMAVMLDEIINYVQSLQNQVEFLSMKLTAASTFYDFNADTDAMEELMQRANAFEAMKSENVANQGIPSAQIDQNLGYCPQLPHSR